MYRQSARLTAVLAATLLLGACSDGPVSPRADGDPLVEAVNRRLVEGGTLILVDSYIRGNVRGASMRGSRVDEERTRQNSHASPKDVLAHMHDISMPDYCISPSDSPSCPQFTVHAGVSGTGTPGRARLSALLAATDNIAVSELDVSFGFKAGCGGSPGTFARHYLSGGSNTPYDLVVSEVHEFTGGAGQWRVNAHGRAETAWASFGDLWASATACH